MFMTLNTTRRLLRQTGALPTVLLGAAVLLAGLYILQTRTTSFGAFVRMAADGSFGAWSMAYAVGSTLLAVLVSLLFGLSLVQIAWFGHRHLLRRDGAISILSAAGGTLFAAFSMGCPACGAFLPDLVGFSNGLAALPLYGLELKALSVVLFGASVAYGMSKIGRILAEEPDDPRASAFASRASRTLQSRTAQRTALVSILIAILALNQLMIGRVAVALGASSPLMAMGDMLRVPEASAKTIIMPMPNSDGKTTSLKGMPTITEVPAEPKSGTMAERGMHVMIAKGTPFYAPKGISFDTPVEALDAWGSYQNLELTSPEMQRFQMLTNMLTCNFCCGSPTGVTMNSNCGCAHAQAARGFFRYMLKTYGEAYSNDELIGEAYRWQAVWYPAGVVEDYFLATGRGNVIGHTTHGGAGSDGMHGLTQGTQTNTRIAPR
ncbi:MAG: hypothetical protein AMXMBFR16_06130 [Candidatus Uhrbacteria bacterium]|nr:MAG: hypothetical protein DCC77_02980 [Candidatus Uhrbacteria bacterium]